MPLFSLKKFRGLFSPRASPNQMSSPASESRSDSQSSSNRDRSQSTCETKSTYSKHRNSVCSTSTPKIVVSIPPSPLLTSSGPKSILIKSSFKVQSETCLREAVNPNANLRNKTQEPKDQQPISRPNKKKVTFAKEVRQSANEQYINLRFVEKFHEKTGACSPRESLPTIKPKQGFSSPQICMQFCPNDGFLPMSFNPKPVAKKAELKVDFLGDDLINREPTNQNNKSPKYQIIKHMECSRQNSLSMLPIIGSPSSVKAHNDNFTFALTSLTPKHNEDSRATFSRRSLFENNSPSNKQRLDSEKATPKHRIRASIGPIEVNNIQALRAAEKKIESEFLDDQSDSRNRAHLLIRKRGSILASH